MRELEVNWKRRGHQICHTHGTSEGGVDVWCRGFYETLPEPLRQAFEAAGWVRLVGTKRRA